MIYIDMDGTIAALGNENGTVVYNEDFHSEFFAEKYFMSNVYDRIESIHGRDDMTILTAIPFENFASHIRCKKEWLKEYKINLPIMFSIYQKQNKADLFETLTKDDVLIDDSTNELLAWSKKGGTAIHASQYY